LNMDTYLACYDYVEYKEQQEISAFLDKNHNIYSLSRIMYFKTILYLCQVF